MSVGRRLARLATDATVRQPRLWPVFRPLLERQFARLADEWDAMRAPDTFAPFEAALAAVEGPVRDALDVGTGTGEGALAIARRFPEAAVVGVDLAEPMLAAARRKAPALRFVRADAAALPFAAASFDLVTHANAIPFPDEVARVLRPGGHALFAFSSGAETPIYVAPERLRDELARRGLGSFEELQVARGTALVARKG